MPPCGSLLEKSQDKTRRLRLLRAQGHGGPADGCYALWISNYPNSEWCIRASLAGIGGQQFYPMSQRGINWSTLCSPTDCELAVGLTFFFSSVLSTLALNLGKTTMLPHHAWLDRYPIRT
ncbi:hypothetical protein VTK73DRAFT_7645 [Phialemonium thermophilum]|uniref:Uncharacterized protein n=1 Tax=Phialemonium thermophilum TaxID=223376 RepID=A0ABR3Y7T6_9PEZI